MADFKNWFVKNVLEQYNKQLPRAKIDPRNSSPMMSKDEVIELAAEVAKQVIDLSVSIPPLEPEGGDTGNGSEGKSKVNPRETSIKDAIHAFCQRARHAWDERERKLLSEVDETALTTDSETTFHADPSLISAIASAGHLHVELNSSVDTSRDTDSKQRSVGDNDTFAREANSLLMASTIVSNHAMVTSHVFTTAEGSGLMRVFPGKSSCFTIFAKDENGQERTLGGDTFCVSAKECKIKPVVRDRHDGTYFVDYRIPVDVKSNSISISVCLGSKHVRGSPFNIPINHVVHCIFLRAWGEKGGKQGQFQHPGGMALSVDRNNVYVVDRFNHRIQVFHLDGTFVRMWGSNGAGTSEFRNPAAVAVRGNIVCVADTTNHRIQIFRRDGTFVQKWGSRGIGQGQFRNPYGLVITDDTIFVGDCGNHRIQVFDLDGTFIRMWGSNGSGEGQLSYPYGLGVDGDFVYVADRNNHRIQIFRQDGTFVRTWGTYGVGDGQFNSPEAIALGNGVVFVTEYGKHRIQVFHRDGTYVQTLGGTSTSNKAAHGLFTFPTALAVHGNTLYMTEADLNRVQVFSLSSSNGTNNSCSEKRKLSNDPRGHPNTKIKSHDGKSDEETESDEDEDIIDLSQHSRNIENTRPNKIGRHS